MSEKAQPIVKGPITMIIERRALIESRARGLGGGPMDQVNLGS